MQLPSVKSSSELKSIQALRGVAALAVTLYHATVILDAGKYGKALPFQGWFLSGDVGVDLFFALSGFIIFYAHRKDIGAPRHLSWYLWRRATRIYPLYWLYLTLLAGIAATGLAYVAARLGFMDYVTSYSLIQFTPAWPLVATSWTLYHEILFYLAFAFFILDRRLGLALFAGWLLVILAALDFKGGTLWKNVTSLYNLYFFLGIGASLAWQKIRHAPLARGLLVAAAALLVLFVLQDHFIGRHQWPWLRLEMMIVCPLLLAGGASLERLSRPWIPAWLLFLGNASYSIYLTHYEVYAALMRLLVHFHWIDRIPADVLFVGIAGIAVSVGCLVHIMVERPLMLLHRRYKPFSRQGTSRTQPGP